MIFVLIFIDDRTKTKLVDPDDIPWIIRKRYVSYYKLVYICHIKDIVKNEDPSDVINRASIT